jgi:Flp pilus assembly protein TadD
MLPAAVRSRPESAEARNDLGVTLVATQNLADANVQFNMALGICPDYAAARQNVAIVQRRQSAVGASTRPGAGSN